ncbi:hypothetical protein [Pseudothauera rhizosphaerae]|nr:hypothetical protein [Pseudothauera rhizosphaerae]
MMAEDGIGDYGFAKRKAARQLGAVDAETLPTNAEIEAELRAWQALYQDEEQTERVREMREAAVEIMRQLETFRPYLTGGVLDGTAGRYAEIEIDLFPESAKEVEIFFLGENVAYEHRKPRQPGPNPPETVLAFDWDDIPVRLSIYPPGAERVGRKPNERARLPQVEALLQAPAPESSL